MSSYKTSSASLVFAAVMLLPNVSFAYTLKHSSSGHVIRWDKNNVTLRVDAELEKMLEPGQIRSAVIMASEAWRGYAGVPDIAIEAGNPPAYSAQHRGNGVYLLHKWPFESRQLAVTVVTYSDSGEVLGADVLVNGEKPFSLFSETPSETADTYDIAAVLTHEFGHVLGLDESYDHPEATMFPQIHQGETHQRVLSADDQDGVMEAYTAPSASSSVPQIKCSVSTPHASQNGMAALFGLCAMSALVISRGRRRSAAH